MKIRGECSWPTRANHRIDGTDNQRKRASAGNQSMHAYQKGMLFKKKKVNEVGENSGDIVHAFHVADPAFPGLILSTADMGP